MVQKRQASPPPEDARDDGDTAGTISAPSAASKGKQRAQLPKLSGSFKLSMAAVPKTPVTQPKPPSAVTPTPVPEKLSRNKDVPAEFLKALGELEALALVASAEVKHAQAEAKKAEGTLDAVLSEVRSFHTRHGL